MLYGIQFCRAVAALLVVLFHASANLAKDRYFGPLAGPMERLFWFGGEAGVAFFFVLSGFIIHQVHRREFDQPQHLASYARKRAVRVYPTYWIVFGAVYLLAALWPTLRDALPGSPPVLLKSLLLLPQDAKLVGGTGAPVLIVAWSLQYEILFYAVFATALIERRLFLALCAILAAHSVLQPVLGPYAFPRSFVANHLVALFGLGMLASVALRRRPMKTGGWVAAGAAGAFLAVAVVATGMRAGYSKPVSDLAYGVVSAVLIYALASHEKQHGRPSGFARFALLGDASYALYLIHFPLIAALSKLSIAVLPMTAGGAWVAFALLVCASVAASVAFHLAIERPLLRRMAPKGPPRRLAVDGR